jgi:hypothetical protein
MKFLLILTVISIKMVQKNLVAMTPQEGEGTYLEFGRTSTLAECTQPSREGFSRSIFVVNNSIASAETRGPLILPCLPIDVLHAIGNSLSMLCQDTVNVISMCMPGIR